MEGKRACAYYTVSGSVKVINAQDATASRAFTVDLDARSGGYDLMVVWVELTDADSSVTSITATAVASHDHSTASYTPQKDTAGGSGWTQTTANVWTKAVAGSVNWPIRMNISGYPGLTVTFAFAGAPTSADLATVYALLCTQ
jgi:hypothetical protein